MRTDRTISTTVGNIRLTDTGGTGMPVLLLHGSGLSRAVFDRQIESPLAERLRLIAPDLPGHGDSEDARHAGDYALPRLADCVSEVIAALGLDRFAIFGWSLGGHIGIELLHRLPGIAGLMLMGTPPVGRGPVAMLRGFNANWDMLLASKERFSPRDIERYAHLCFGDDVPPGALEAIRRADGRIRPAVSRSMLRGEGADQRRTVETADVPVAIIAGQHDPLVRLGYLSGLAVPYLWDGHVIVLPGTGHAAFREAADQFNALLLRFAADAEAMAAMPARSARRA